MWFASVWFASLCGLKWVLVSCAAHCEGRCAWVCLELTSMGEFYNPKGSLKTIAPFSRYPQYKSPSVLMKMKLNVHKNMENP